MERVIIVLSLQIILGGNMFGLVISLLTDNLEIKNAEFWHDIEKEYEKPVEV